MLLFWSRSVQSALLSLFIGLSSLHAVSRGSGILLDHRFGSLARIAGYFVVGVPM